ncbi:MAG: hypothetical protein GEU81_13585 [Nitriliruptorales bacterium]|nr:hypothetical protein [Nitriliruptorales bacterium]
MDAMIAHTQSFVIVLEGRCPGTPNSYEDGAWVRRAPGTGGRGADRALAMRDHRGRRLRAVAPGPRGLRPVEELAVDAALVGMLGWTWWARR